MYRNIYEVLIFSHPNSQRQGTNGHYAVGFGRGFSRKKTKPKAEKQK